MHLPETALD